MNRKQIESSRVTTKIGGGDLHTYHDTVYFKGKECAILTVNKGSSVHLVETVSRKKHYWVAFRSIRPAGGYIPNPWMLA
jgi:hypothetical protein